MLDEKKAAEEDAARKAAETAGAGADSWRDFVKDTGFSFDEYMQRLRDQVKAQDDWKTNMLILAGRVSQGTLEELARMGPEGAPLVADLVTKSDDILKEYGVITAARSKEATDAWGANLTMASPVLTALAEKAGRGVAEGVSRELAAGTTSIAAVVAKYGLTVVGGINPILDSLGKPRITTAGNTVPQGFVGPVQWANADGNVYEDHSPQIARAGDWRVWAEPETGGESYIPHAASKRPRALDIWRQTGRILNAPEAQYFASGGFASAADVPKPYSTAPARPPISSPADAAMQREYDAITAWLKANVGTAGTGHLTGGVSGMFAAVKAHFPEARLNSGFRPGDPGYHGLGRAIDLGQIGRAGGNGHPYLANMNRWLHDTYGANLAELIYDGLGDDRPDLKNGRPLTYSAATRAQHHNHVHVAMAKGGILNPHVRDSGGPLLPGYTYNGTRRSEWVVPTPGIPVGGSRSAQAGGQVVVVIEGAEIAGTFEIGGDGLGRIVNGHITSALTGVAQTARNGVRS